MALKYILKSSSSPFWLSIANISLLTREFQSSENTGKPWEDKTVSIRISVDVKRMQSLTPSSPSTTEDRARFRAESAAVNAFFFLSLVSAALIAVDEVDGFSSFAGKSVSVDFLGCWSSAPVYPCYTNEQAWWERSDSYGDSHQVITQFIKLTMALRMFLEARALFLMLFK